MTRAEAVHVLARDPALGASLARLLAASGIEAVACPSARELLARVGAGGGCVLADVEAPGLDALCLRADLERAGAAAAIVLLAPRAGACPAGSALRSEGVELIEEPCEASALVAAVERALEALRSRAAAASGHRDLERRLQALTRREREVFALVTAGLANKSIAARLGASEKTVKIHRGRVMRKMGAETLAHLVRMAEALAPALSVPGPSV